MAVIGREQDQRVARRPRRERALEGPVEEGGLGGMLLRLRPRHVRDRVDPRPVRVHVGGPIAPRPLLEEIPQPNAHRRRQVVPGVLGPGGVHAVHRLESEWLRLDHICRHSGPAKSRIDRTDPDVNARVHTGVVKVGAAPVHGGPPAQHLRDLRELLEPDEVREVPVLLGCPSRVERRDRRGGGRRKDRRGFDELRPIMAGRALDDRCDERHVAGRAESA